MHRVIIVGGGIGGMTLAAALTRAGVDAEVYEQAPEIREVGAAVALWPNARFALEQIGAHDAAVRGSRPITRVEGLNGRGRRVMALDYANAWSDAPDVSCYLVPRARLLAALQARVPVERVHTGHRCVEITQERSLVRARFDNGVVAEGTVLVGADGLRSAVRPVAIGPDLVRYSGQTCFRGLASFQLREPDVLREVQGPGQRCGIAPVGDGLVYWWLAWNAPAGSVVPPADRQADALRRYAEWPAEITSLIAATPTEDILHNDLCDRAPAPRWSSGRLTLLGDAAHPTTPNLGQGANMAIDDGVVLARLLRETSDVEACFRAYEHARMPRTSLIVKRSWQFGQLMLWRNPLAVSLREAMTRSTPRSVMTNALRWQVLEHVEPLMPGPAALPAAG